MHIQEKCWNNKQGRSQGGSHRCMCTPLFKNKKKQNYFLSTIIPFYTINPKCLLCLFIILSKWLPDLAPWPPYQGFALDPLGALSGPQTLRPIILHPPFLIPGYGPDKLWMHINKRADFDQNKQCISNAKLIWTCKQLARYMCGCFTLLT